MMKRLLIPALALCGMLVASVATADVASSAQEIEPILVGAETPDVSVGKLDGSTVSMKEVLGEQPTVLIFYRGGW